MSRARSARWSRSSERDATWIAAALSDDDRAAAKSGSLDDLDIDLRLVALDPELHTMHYDVVSNSVLWFLFHDLFDRMRRPRFDDRFREAWEAYRTVNDAFADATADAAATGDVVLVNDYQLSLAGARLRELRPDLRIVHFTHTPFCGPDDMRVLPTYAADDLCAVAGRATRPASTPRAGPARTTSRRATCSAGARRSRRRSPRASAPTSPRSTTVATGAAAHARPRTRSTTRSATGS